LLQLSQQSPNQMHRIFLLMTGKYTNVIFYWSALCEEFQGESW
jgi:hypothetical protein